MAIRRMFAKTVIDTDRFMEMPLSTQCLYFHLLLYGDDDGFVASPKRIMRLLGASEDDMRILIAKEYIHAFASGIIVIRHWRVHNKIRNDRYSPTTCEEISLLVLDENNVYQLLPSGSKMATVGTPHGIPTGNQSGNHVATNGIPDGIPSDNQAATNGETYGEPSGTHSGYRRGPKDRIGKVRIGKYRLGKDRLGEDRIDEMATNPPPFDEILALYHELCPAFLPVKALTQQREKAMKKLYALLGGSMEAIKEYFQKCADTPFLCGKNRDGWRANLDFLLDQNKYISIMEGKYDAWKDTSGRNGIGSGHSDKAEGEASSFGAELEAFERQQNLPGEL